MTFAVRAAAASGRRAPPRAAAGTVIATALAVSSGLSCGELRYDRAEWQDLDRREFAYRREYAECVVEVQPFRGLDRASLVRRLGAPDERRGRELWWWIAPDEAFDMRIDTLVIPIDDRGRAGRARFRQPG